MSSNDSFLQNARTLFILSRIWGLYSFSFPKNLSSKSKPQVRTFHVKLLAFQFIIYYSILCGHVYVLYQETRSQPLTIGQWIKNILSFMGCSALMSNALLSIRNRHILWFIIRSFTDFDFVVRFLFILL